MRMSKAEWDQLTQEDRRGTLVLAEINLDDPATQASIREQEAYHEAGHAVVMVHLGRAFRQVSVERVAEEHGYRIRGVEWVGDLYEGVDLTSVRRAWRSKIDNLAICFAGEVGQVLTLERHAIVLSDQDEQDVVSMVSVFFPNAETIQTMALEAGRRRAEQLLWENPKNGEAVRQLATALLVQPTIDYKEACRIIRRARQSIRVR